MIYVALYVLSASKSSTIFVKSVHLLRVSALRQTRQIVPNYQYNWVSNNLKIDVNSVITGFVYSCVLLWTDESVFLLDAILISYTVWSSLLYSFFLNSSLMKTCYLKIFGVKKNIVTYFI